MSEVEKELYICTDCGTESEMHPRYTEECPACKSEGNMELVD